MISKYDSNIVLETIKQCGRMGSFISRVRGFEVDLLKMVYKVSNSFVRLLEVVS